MWIRFTLNIAAQWLIFTGLRNAASKPAITIITDAILKGSWIRWLAEIGFPHDLTDYLRRIATVLAVNGEWSVIALLLHAISSVVYLSVIFGITYAILRYSGRRGKKMDWYYENIPFGYVIPMPTPGKELPTRNFSCEHSISQSPSNSPTFNHAAGAAHKTTKRERVIARLIIISPLVVGALCVNGVRALPILFGLGLCGFLASKFYSAIEEQAFPESQEYNKEEKVQKVLFGAIAILLALVAARMFWMAYR